MNISPIKSRAGINVDFMYLILSVPPFQ